MPVLLPGDKPLSAAASARATGNTNRTPPARPCAGGVAEASSGSKPSPGYRRYSMLDLAFFFRAIPAEELEVDADHVDEPEVDGDLVDDLEVDGDLVDDLEADLEDLKQIPSRIWEPTKNLGKISTKNSKSMKMKLALVPPTWCARCRFLDHGPWE